MDVNVLKRKGDSMKENYKDDAEHITAEECKKKIINIFTKMDEPKKIKFWYRYILAIEKGRV